MLRISFLFYYAWLFLFILYLRRELAKYFIFFILRYHNSFGKLLTCRSHFKPLQCLYSTPFLINQGSIRRRLRKKQESTFGYEPISADFGFRGKSSWLPGSLEKSPKKVPKLYYLKNGRRDGDSASRNAWWGAGGRMRAGASDGSMARPQGRVDMLQYQPLNSNTKYRIAFSIL
jgi:hypothetical protein